MAVFLKELSEVSKEYLNKCLEELPKVLAEKLVLVLLQKEFFEVLLKALITELLVDLLEKLPKKKTMVKLPKEFLKESLDELLLEELVEELLEEPLEDFLLERTQKFPKKLSKEILV